MRDSRKFSLNPEFRVERFDNEIILYAISSTKGVYLNETAYLVWQMCEDGNSVGEIIALLKGEYPLQKVNIQEDVVAAIESLVGSGVLIPIDD